MFRTLRSGFQGDDDDVLDLVDGDRRSFTRARVIGQSVESFADEPAALFAHRRAGHPEIFYYLGVGQSVGAGQHDLGAQRQSLRGRASASPAGQLVAFIVGECQWCFRSSCGRHAPNLLLEDVLTVQDTSNLA